MADKPRSLETLRKELDQLDQDLVGLLRRRATIVQEVGRSKSRGGRGSAGAAGSPGAGGTGNGFILRPGREAEILRRLAQAEAAPLENGNLLRIFREVIGSLYGLQGRVRVAIQADGDRLGVWDIARNHFGASAQISWHNDPGAVIGAVCETPNCVGLIATPDDEGRVYWWRQLAATAGLVPKVIGGLPFYAIDGGTLPRRPAWLMVGPGMPDPSGDDVSLVYVTVELEEMSRGRFIGMFADAGLTARMVTATAAVERGSDPAAGGPRDFLVEIDDYLPQDDPRIEAFRRRAGEAVSHVAVIGAYAVPLGAGPASG